MKKNSGNSLKDPHTTRHARMVRTANVRTKARMAQYSGSAGWLNIPDRDCATSDSMDQSRQSSLDLLYLWEVDLDDDDGTIQLFQLD